MWLSCRETDGEPSTGVGRGGYREFAAHHTHTLSEADQAQPRSPRRRRRIEPPPIVSHLHREMAVASIERHRHVLCPGVCRDVAQRFLDHAIEAERKGIRHVPPRIGNVQPYGYAAFLAEIITPLAKRFEQAEMLERARVKFV